MSFKLIFSTPCFISLTLAITILAFSVHFLLYYGSRASNLPPGPRTIPIIGNLLDMPRAKLHLGFTEMAKVYGDIFSLKVLNQTIIVINSPLPFRELIDKRSASSCNRPKSVIADMIIPNGMNMGTAHQANLTWKSMRRATSQLFNKENMRSHDAYQRAEAIQLMWDLTHFPEDWYSHIRRFTTSFALGIIYGKRGPRISSPDVADFLDVHPKFLHALEIGTLPPVDLFPFLPLVPERWASWKGVVRNIRLLHERLFDRLLTTVETRMSEGLGIGVFLEHIIQQADQYGLHTREHLRNLGGTLLEGSDTCSATLQFIVYCMINFPHVLQKAREEVDRVVGADRTPDWNDIPNLPYMLAIIEECHRYRPAGPLGLPHSMVNDEIIDGVLYPKDATIFINLWGIFHDERFFDQPEEFNPERFLKHPLGVKEGVEQIYGFRPNMVFGGGRRVCPGIVFAKSSLEIAVANFIWGFEFLPAVDPISGKQIPPSLDEYACGVTATPKELPVRISPRSAGHRNVINRQFSDSSDILAAFELELSDEDKAFNAIHRDSM